MSIEVTLLLLALLLLVAVCSLLISVVLWQRHEAMGRRVTRLEAHRESGLSQAEVREFYERLSSIEGQIETTNHLMQTVHRHLLENER